MSSLDAFSIDAMLPALEQISSDLGVTIENRRQYIVTALFAGFSVGVLFYGFVADAIGRRPPVLFGFALYGIGTLACIMAESFGTMLFGRFTQGIGAAGPYVLAIAIVRDSYKGEEMAKLMSLVMMVFIGVPMIAPFVGQGVLLLAGWRAIFIALGLFGALTMIWFWQRQPETLGLKNTSSLRLSTVKYTVAGVLQHPVSFRYLLIIGFIAGAFIAYLSTAQQIFQQQYQLGHRFPATFACLAAMFGLGSFVNSRLVEKFGAVVMVRAALITVVASSVLYLLIYSNLSSLPPLNSHLLYNAIISFCFAFLFGNTTAIAMEPMGHIAGGASSIINSLSTIIAIVVATIIGSQITVTGHPIAIGYAATGIIALVLSYTTPRFSKVDY